MPRVFCASAKSGWSPSAGEEVASQLPLRPVRAVINPRRWRAPTWPASASRPAGRAVPPLAVGRLDRPAGHIEHLRDRDHGVGSTDSRSAPTPGHRAADPGLGARGRHLRCLPPTAPVFSRALRIVKIRPTRSCVGHAGVPPGREQTNAATSLACRLIASSGRPARRPTTIAAVKASPAPMVSLTSTGTPG